MNAAGLRLMILMPLIIAGAAIATLLSSLGGNVRVAHALVPAPVCFAKVEGGAVFASATFTAPQAAVDSLGAGGGVVLVAGTCTGVEERESFSQTVYISAPVTLRGGYDNLFNVLDPISHPTVMDADRLGHAVRATAALTVENLTLQNGYPPYYGGGLRIDGTLTMTNSRVVSNMAPTGAGIWANGDATIFNSRIENNQSIVSAGGGLIVYGDLTIVSSQVVSNTAKKRGGGLLAIKAVTLVDSRVENNHSFEETGGGLDANTTLTMTNTQVLSNTAFYGGGGVHVVESAMVVDSRLENNRSMTDEGGGLRVLGSLDMSNTQVLSNTAMESGGGIRVASSANILNSRIENNVSTANDGGGLHAGTTLTMTKSQVRNNQANGFGGGVAIWEEATIVNSLLVSNTAAHGGAIWSESPLHLASSTLAANHAGSTGGAISTTAPISIANNIIWLNTPNQVAAGSSLSISRSIVQNGEGGGINEDPLFLRNPEPASDDLGDVHLSEFSPALDAGDDSLVSASMTSDLDGNPRKFDVLMVANNGANIVDLGAYERNSQLTPPTADAGGPYNGVEGTPVAVDGSGSSGLRPLETYAWDCTDDGVFDVSSANPADSACLYADNGVFGLRLFVTDAVGMTGADTVSVTILNAAPVVAASADHTATEGISQSYGLGSFSDAGVDDAPWHVQIDWGDSSTPTTFDRDSQGDLPAQSHTYIQQGQYSGTVTVTDKDGDAGSAGFQTNVGPPDSGGVQGAVFEDKNGNQQPDGGEGVAGAIVSLTEVSAAVFTNPVQTDEDGNYVFSDVPVGDYALDISAAGYLSPATVPLTVEKNVVKTVTPVMIERATETLYLPTVQSTSAVQATE